MDKFFKEKSEEVIKYRFENPQKAFEICYDILKHGDEQNDWYEVAYAQLYMGDTLFSMGKINEAIDHMLLGEKIQKKYGYDDLLMKNCQYNIDIRLPQMFWFQEIYFYESSESFLQ